MNRTSIMTTTLAALTIAGPAIAQTNANRSAEAIAVHPQVGGTALIEAYFSIEGGDIPMTQDMTTTIEFLINGTTVGFETMDALVGPSCPGCPPEFNCVWIGDGSDEWACQAAMTKAELVASLQPGDEIMVILYPAPGGPPDGDPTDDSLTQQYHGDPIFWNRRIAGASMEAAAGDHFFDVWVELEASANYAGTLDLRTEIVLLLDGVEVATAPAPSLVDDLTFNPCTFEPCNDTVACVMNPSEGWYGSCQPDEELDECGCLYHPVPDTQPVPTFELIPIPPGTGVTVFLRPVPGALPELPGFPDDDEEEVPQDLCPADTNGDGFVNVQDLIVVILDWGCKGQDCAGDVNDDGKVDVEDLVAVIIAWGQCFDLS